jgi:hypothetical protein
MNKMKTLILILIFPLLLSAQDRVPYKDYCGECYTMINDSTWVNGVWLPIPEEKELDIKPSDKVFLEPEKFIPKYHTEAEINMPNSKDGILYGIRFGLLIIATLFYFYGLKNITIFSTHNELRQ